MTTGRIAPLSALLATLLVAPTLLAQGAPPPAGYPPPPNAYAPPPPGYYPPPPGAYAPPGYPAVDPTVHNHDGFYLQMALGIAYASVKESVNGNELGTISGGGGAGHLLIGGTIARGLVLGGGLQVGVFPGPKVSTAGYSGTASSDLKLNVTTLGPFVDYYFDAAQGLHLQGLIGIGTLSVSDSNGNRSTDNPSGLAASLGIGNEWWIGEQWSFGILGRIQIVNAKSSSSSEVKDTAIVPALLATFTLH
jgi:hypothetical protein